MTTAQVVLDGVDVTEFAVEGSVKTVLNAVGTASVRLEMRDGFAVYGAGPFPACGSYLKVYFDTGGGPVLWHHGRVMQCETTADENNGYTVFNSADALELWSKRPVRDPPDSSGIYGAPGNFSKPSIIQDFGNPATLAGYGGPRIVEAMMDGSELNTIPSESEGPLRLARGSFAAGTVNLTGAPSDWPMTMADLAALLTGTGVVDIVITPIEFDGSNNYGQIDVYNGDYGTDLTASVAFSYGMGDFNVRALRWNEDMSAMCNKLWYFLGPKCDDQHWRANVQGDDPFLTYPPGGALSPPASALANVVGTRDYFSRYTAAADGLGYDVRMEIRIYDASGDGADCSEAVVVGHELYRRLWQIEQYLRAVPQTLVHVTPIRDYAIGTFSIGDLVTVEASADVKGGFSGAQRVYSYTISWDEDSVPAIGELQTSADQENFQ